MNIHHLELFYYVARHGGISEAVRNMPYGIQQPAISGQIIQLEESLGLTLFQRRPFQLTPAGEELFEFVRPFFDNVGKVADRLRGGVLQHLRVAASEIVIRDYLPAFLGELREAYPKLRVTLREGYYPQVLNWFRSQSIDASIGLIAGKLPAGIHSLKLFKLPLVLLVPGKSKLKSADELWQRDRIEETLITVPSNEPLSHALQQGLKERSIDWFSGIEVSTLDLVQTYVANGYGIGVTVGIPKAKYHPQVRVLPLNDFPLTTFGVLWQGRRTSVLDGLVEIVKREARRMWEGEDPDQFLLKGNSRTD